MHNDDDKDEKKGEMKKKEINHFQKVYFIHTYTAQLVIIYTLLVY